jgi:hypothetical protein
MSMYTRCLRLGWLVPNLAMRVAFIMACFLLMYETGLLVWNSLMAPKFGRGAEYVMYSSLALAFMAEQKLQYLIDFRSYVDALCHKFTLRYANSGPFFEVGLFAQITRFDKLLMNIDIDANGKPVIWNSAWTAHIIVPSQHGAHRFDEAVVRSGPAGPLLFSGYVVELHYWLPADRYSHAPMQSDATIELKCSQRATLEEFLAYCKRFVHGARAPLMRVADVSTGTLNVNAADDDDDDGEERFARDAPRAHTTQIASSDED